VIKERKEKIANTKKNMTKISLPKSKTTFNDKIFNKNELP
jgi:hypothetical protein